MFSIYFTECSVTLVVVVVVACLIYVDITEFTFADFVLLFGYLNF